MRKFSSYRNSNKEVRRVGNCKGKPMPDDQVANGGKRSIGSVGSGSGSVQCGSKLDRILHQI